MSASSRPSKLRLREALVDLAHAEVVRADGQRTSLTAREVDLLAYLAAHTDRAVSRGELLVEVWGYAPSTVSRAVDTAVRRLREKIESDPQHPDHLITAFGAGYRLLTVQEEEESELLEPVHVESTSRGEPFIGRVAETAEILSALRACKPRIVALQGPPGVGKSALAARCLGKLSEGEGALRGGQISVDLADLRDPADLYFATARALGISTQGSRDLLLRRLCEALRARGPCAALLDSCEGKGPVVAAAIAALAEEAPELRILVASREEIPEGGPPRLLVRLSPLSSAESVALFVMLVRRGRPDLRLDPQSRETIAQLVSRLDHLPLAVRLAAGRAETLSPKALLDRIDGQLAKRGEHGRFQLLASRERDSLARHKSLRAALDASWELLGPSEREILTATSATRGGFDADAAEALSERPDARALLGQLSGRSLLERRPQDGPECFGIYLSVREYAAERLAEDPARERAVFRRHAETYLARAKRGDSRASLDRTNLAAAVERASQLGWPDLAGGCALALLDLVGREGPCELGIAVARVALSLRDLSPRDAIEIGIRLASLEQWTGEGDAMATLDRALAGALGSNELDLVASAYRTRAMIVRTRFGAADALLDLQLAEQISRVCGRQAVWGTCAASLAGALRESGDVQRARALLQEVVQRADDDSATHALLSLALIARRQGRFDEARAMYLSAHDRKEAARDRRGMALALLGLGNLEAELGHLPEAHESYTRALQIGESLGLTELSARALGNLGLVARLSGRLSEATDHLVRAHSDFERLGEARMAAIARGNLGSVALASGQLGEAQELLQEAARTLGHHRDPSAIEHESHLAEVLIARSELQQARALLDRIEPGARKLGEPLLLGLVLARKAMLEQRLGLDAQPTLDEATSCASGLSEDSELGQLLAVCQGQSSEGVAQ